jgi:hypothetical protein
VPFQGGPVKPGPGSQQRAEQGGDMFPVPSAWATVSSPVDMPDLSVYQLHREYLPNAPKPPQYLPAAKRHANPG